VFSLVELKTATLDAGIPGISLMHAMLLLLMITAIPIIPYAIYYLSLKKAEHEKNAKTRPSKIAAWMHAHRPPILLHH